MGPVCAGKNGCDIQLFVFVWLSQRGERSDVLQKSMIRQRTVVCLSLDIRRCSSFATFDELLYTASMGLARSTSDIKNSWSCSKEAFLSAQLTFFI